MEITFIKSTTCKDGSICHRISVSVDTELGAVNMTALFFSSKEFAEGEVVTVKRDNWKLVERGDSLPLLTPVL